MQISSNRRRLEQKGIHKNALLLQPKAVAINASFLLYATLGDRQHSRARLATVNYVILFLPATIYIAL